MDLTTLLNELKRRLRTERIATTDLDPVAYYIANGGKITVCRPAWARGSLRFGVKHSYFM